MSHDVAGRQVDVYVELGFVYTAMTTAFTLSLVVAGLLVALVYAGRHMFARERTAKADGSYARQFVWVEDDGSVRELTPDETDYLNTELHPGDGARPYIKSAYTSRSADDRLSGFLLRRKVPHLVIIRP